MGRGKEREVFREHLADVNVPRVCCEDDVNVPRVGWLLMLLAAGAARELGLTCRLCA